MTFLDAKLQGFGDHAGGGHGLNITKHLAGSKMFHLPRFNLHVNEEACHREEGSNNQAPPFWNADGKLRSRRTRFIFKQWPLAHALHFILNAHHHPGIQGVSE